MSISQLTFFMLSNADDLAIGTVVFTGITIVFFVLVLLYIVISIEGVIFTSIENKNKAKANVQTNSEQEVVKIEVVAEKAKTEGEVAPPKVQDGISGEVVAAITAAIAYMQDADGVDYTISTVTRAKTKKQSAWSSSAAAAYTEPF